MNDLDRALGMSRIASAQRGIASSLRLLAGTDALASVLATRAAHLARQIDELADLYPNTQKENTDDRSILDPRD